MFSRSLPFAAAAALLFGGALCAQTPAAPAFEVASIKPAPPLDPAKIMSGQMHIGMSIDGARVDIGFLNLQQLLCVAYKIKPYQLDAPDWTKDQHWDIQAKMPAGANKDQVPEMLQGLLADRFKLTIRHATTEHAVYALVVAKGGHKMKEAEPDAPPPAPSPDGQPPEEKPLAKGEFVVGRGDSATRITPTQGGRGVSMTNPKFGPMKMSAGENGAMVMEFGKMKMDDFAGMLGPFLDHPVIDETELKGAYKVALEMTMEDMMRVARASGVMGAMGGPGAAPAGDASRPAEAASAPSTSIFTAVQKLGLKLENKKAPVDTVVVVHLEKTPTEN
jgi:uncharacterized protein (TIGR03435 family)